MKKYILVFLTIGIILIASNPSFSNESKKQRKEREKLEAAIKDSIKFEKASAVLKEMDFAIGATRISFKDGTTVYTESNINFISVHNEKAVVQLAFPSHPGGLNGLGGITVDGRYSNLKTETDKKGNLMLEFSVIGRNISARINIFLAKGSDIATATVFPNFKSETLTIYGDVIPYNKSNIFTGSSY